MHISDWLKSTTLWHKTYPAPKTGVGTPKPTNMWRKSANVWVKTTNVAPPPRGRAVSPAPAVLEQKGPAALPHCTTTTNNNTVTRAHHHETTHTA
eukprot:8961571-Heterocapsa_arctica.AAC.1